MPLSRSDGLQNLDHLYDGGELWVFGYGSLMWRPGFPYLEAHPALIRGVHRAACVISHRHRGTWERPGIVMGLDAGGSCKGRVYRVAASESAGVLDYLHDREMGGYDVYKPVKRPVVTLTSYQRRQVSALCFVVDRGHAQYAGRLSRSELVSHIRQGVGEGGTCRDYFKNLVHHLDDLGVAEGAIHRLYGVASSE
tara:strand:- start:4246 stop:4830 length:585 start_codon:yes stop_codon:yes gene_type:complete